MGVRESFLATIVVIFSVPYLIWRIFRTNDFAPLAVVQIIVGVILGPGIMGIAFPSLHAALFSQSVIDLLSGLSWWAVMLFVWLSGIELDLSDVWAHKRESAITAGLALGVPVLFGGAAAAVISTHGGWIGTRGSDWQFILGIGVSCAVTALPILVLLMERLDILRQPIGQRILRYASADDIVVWGILTIILTDWNSVGREVEFLVGFAAAAYAFRRVMPSLAESDRWYVSLIWLSVSAFGAELSGISFMVGAFLAGAAIESRWFDVARLDWLRRNVAMFVMPVFFLSTGLRTNWTLGGSHVFLVAGALLVAAIGGKLAGTALAGRILKWRPGEATIFGWMLQTKSLIMVTLANILFDHQIITSEMFTALLLMAVVSTMLTIPVVAPRLQRMQELILRAK